MSSEAVFGQEPKIIEAAARKLIGKRVKTSFSEDKTSRLWSEFRPQIKEITNNLQSGLYSVQIFEAGTGLENFTPRTEFEKWAAIEVNSFDELPAGMETYLLPGGKYAVFDHQGAADSFPQITRRVFELWLPSSDYEFDLQRPRFEILGTDYNPFDPNSREEIWIPIKSKY